MNENKPFAKTQHYVPKFLLKNFASTGNEQLFVFDKKEERAFRANIRKVAAENGLYDLELPDGKVSAEPMLSKLEGDASRAIEKLLKAQNIRALSEDDRIVIGLFVAVQMLRVTHLIDVMFDITETIRRRWGTIPGMPETESDARKQARESLVNNLSTAKDFLPEFLNKTWLLLKVYDKSDFYISDNPVAMHNIHSNPWRGGLGLSVRGIEVYLPLSSTITLAFFCKSKEEGWLRSKAQFEIAKTLNLTIPNELAASAATFFEVVRGLESGDPVQISEEVTNFQNELQIWHSSRFIFSKKGDFGPVQEAIKRNPKFKFGPRLAGG
jgi:hypothetical protein